ncbi:hypothetical protein LSTR_LSTR015588 [Laodelphax striatellus]|uniref:S-adenosylmethionine sensor upstream of mTORC1 n=1 Tax=Laodelphax striatellus TaxID=195883 RepID=A0A482XEC4_LAOST|nr:hypothetical protein LSTR_LSTR015588 [Laodelphax striatellus]
MASQEHKDLANTIKGTHVKLRKAARVIGGEEAWTMHVKNRNELKEYATAMHKLATEHWDKSDKNVSRIQWVVEVCREYFKNGGHQSAIRKEENLQRVFFNKELEASEVDDGDLVDSNKELEASKVNDSNLHGVDSNKTLEASEVNYGDSRRVDFSRKLEARKVNNGDLQKVDSNNGLESDEVCLLDVGSCYNPFKNFDIFDKLTAIDLVPATNDVLQCDFLNLEIVSDSSLVPTISPCKTLPGGYFNVVVFSLLLEYLPCKKQRWVCCLKAYKLLKQNGLLIIITPDSKHASANSKLIKSWRLALASIGFMLLKCEKQQHLNCLAYRKCFNPKVAAHWLSLQKSGNMVPEDMICIPQDFNDYEDEEEDSERVVLDRDSIVDDFSELPSSDYEI